jgi:predicted AlkP superfamily phosphohydrolase/phosphomutase
MSGNKKNINRREFLKTSAGAAAAMSVLGHAPSVLAAPQKRAGTSKVIVIGIDGMDPRLTESLMAAGQLPNFNKLRQMGGYRPLGTSVPPQSPVAWACFINGADPGSHGIFDFIHRNPEEQVAPFYAAAETVPGKGFWQIGEHNMQLPFWPFNHQPAETILRRKGVPFWDYLDDKGINSTFYDLPSNYPASESKCGHHKCLSGMGTPDVLGSYGTYQHFSEDGPIRSKDEGGGRRSFVNLLDSETAELELLGPTNTMLTKPEPVKIKFKVHRDKISRAAAIDIQNHKLLLKEGQWSDWIKLDFAMSMPTLIPNEHVSGIVRFYLQEVSPTFRLYVTPINVDPTDPYQKISEPDGFIKDISSKLGLFYTTGFQEDHKALSNGVFTDEEFADQAMYVLKERFRLLDYALENYDDGLLFFYFSSTDLQSHMFWWDSNDKHPIRSFDAAKLQFEHIKGVYRRMDKMLGEMLKRYGDQATLLVLSDHGFANFGRQFNINTWLRDNGYLYPADCKDIMSEADWTKTKAYGLGINGLYLNLAGREKHGIVNPEEKEQLLQELIEKLEAIRDENGAPVIRKVYRSDKAYSGTETRLAPDLIVGYYRGYRASWATCLGGIEKEVLSDNESAWSADHCADAQEVPGILFSNKPIKHETPSLVDLAPSILAQYDIKQPDTMTGKNIFV